MWVGKNDITVNIQSRQKNIETNDEEKPVQHRRSLSTDDIIHKSTANDSSDFHLNPISSYLPFRPKSNRKKTEKHLLVKPTETYTQNRNMRKFNNYRNILSSVH